MLPEDRTYDRLEHEFPHALHQVIGGMLVNGTPKIDTVAESVGGSVRTLQRRLSEMDTTFSEVIEAAKMRRAVKLLVRDDVSLAQIAYQLGYSDQANFGRAFRRWAGMTPARYRRLQFLNFEKAN